jgi:formylmethanofuran dehydrogenase subunit B
MQEVICTKCGTVCAYARDTDGDLTTIHVKCVCGNNNIATFIGYPNLFGTDDYYFEFVDEDKIECHKR